jgi:hypothetical protein
MVSVAVVADVTVWAVIEAETPEIVKVGLPGVPAVHEVPTPVNEIVLPVLEVITKPGVAVRVVYGPAWKFV